MLVSILLTLFGSLLLLASLAAVALGLFVAARPGTRGSGLFFALWWTPAVVASAGVMMHDSVTFFIGVGCFAVAGGALHLERRVGHPSAEKTLRGPEVSEHTTQERVRTNTQRKAAS